MYFNFSLALMSGKMLDLFEDCNNKNCEFDNQDIMFILENNYIASYFLSGIPSDNDNTIVLDVGEIELSEEDIEIDDFSEFTINDGYGYYYIGYGLEVIFDLKGIIKDVLEIRKENK